MLVVGRIAMVLVALQAAIIAITILYIMIIGDQSNIKMMAGAAATFLLSGALAYFSWCDFMTMNDCAARLPSITN